MTSETKLLPDLPQGIGRLSRPWWWFIAAATAILVLGIYAFILQSTSGMVVTNMRNTGTMGGATWGLYIVMVEYFIGVSFAGIVISAISELFRIKELQPITRTAELLTVSALMVGVLAVVVDLGHPIRGVINMLKYGRPQSPFFGTFTLVAVGVLFASLTYLYLGGRRDAATMAAKPSRLQWFHRLWAAGYGDTADERERHRKAMVWMAVGIIPLIVIALSTEGLVFGLQVGRPGRFGSLQGPDFLVLAAVSGLGNLAVLAALVRWVHPNGHRIGPDVFKWLARFLILAVATALYFMVVEVFTLLYATPADERLLADELLRGSYAFLFWLSHAAMLIALLILIREAVRGRWRMGAVVAAGILGSTSALAERYLTVVPSQTHATLLPYETGSYFPSWVEFAVVAGMYALGALLIGLFMKAFPVLPLEDADKEVTIDA
jgi:molybdopterin-containing oxidoreductase family membrane subunit